MGLAQPPSSRQADLIAWGMLGVGQRVVLYGSLVVEPESELCPRGEGGGRLIVWPCLLHKLRVLLYILVITYE